MGRVKDGGEILAMRLLSSHSLCRWGMVGRRGAVDVQMCAFARTAFRLRGYVNLRLRRLDITSRSRKASGDGAWLVCSGRWTDGAVVWGPGYPRRADRAPPSWTWGREEGRVLNAGCVDVLEDWSGLEWKLSL